jgi:alpha-tubulin suppressor-like RCC1 family protein
LGHGGRFNEALPKRIELTVNGEAAIISSIVAGATHTGVVTSRGDVYTFGSGSLYELGNELTSCQYRPVLLTSLATDTPCRALALGANYTVALTGSPSPATAASSASKEAKTDTDVKASSTKRVYNAGGLLETPELQVDIALVTHRESLTRFVI